MWEGLVFGWRTAILTVALAQLLLLSVALMRPLRNRLANRSAAALLVILAGILMPWLIGFAGFYDKWSWLTFAPFQITLAVAPLFYMYVHSLVSGNLPRPLYRYFALPSAQFAFLASSFMLPLQIKDRWADLIEAPYAIVTGILLLAGMVGYSSASFKLLRDYRCALTSIRSDDHRYAAQWLQAALFTIAILFVTWAIYLVWDLISPLGYSGLMGLYLAIAAFAVYFGVEAWRHSSLPFPRLADLRLPIETSPPARDWSTLANSWSDRVREAEWYVDPDLSLPMLARRLGTNSGHLSRAINEGLGVNFSAFINGLRSRKVAEMIDAGRNDDLLDLALEAGFSSKASFNRAFLTNFGVTPSRYRSRHMRRSDRVSENP